MNRIMAMGDIHGCYKALQQCLERAAFDNENDMWIQQGGINDGYPEVFECVELLLEIKNLIAIKGNRDDWFCIIHGRCRTFRKPDDFRY